MAFSDYAHLCVANNSKSILNNKYNLKDIAVELYKGFVYLHNQALWEKEVEKDFEAPIFKQMSGNDLYCNENTYVVTRKAPNGGVYVYAQQEWGSQEQPKLRCFAGIATPGYKNMVPEAIRRIDEAHPELNLAKNFAEHEEDFSISTVYSGDKTYFSIILPENLYPKADSITIDDADLFSDEWIGIDKETLQGFEKFVREQSMYRNEAWYENIDFTTLSYINPGDQIIEDVLGVDASTATAGESAVTPHIHKVKI